MYPIRSCTILISHMYAGIGMNEVVNEDNDDELEVMLYCMVHVYVCMYMCAHTSQSE